jgi:hypothetical protein
VKNKEQDNHAKNYEKPLSPEFIRIIAVNEGTLGDLTGPSWHYTPDDDDLDQVTRERSGE